ncbi:MAG: TonB-dependent receptor [Maricaulaceae bacterium]
MMNSLKTLVAGVSLIPLMSTAAFAQDSAGKRYGEDEIIVTATKVAQGIQDVSVAVTALDETSLDIAGIVDPTRLGLVVPGMQFGYSGNEARIAMRGARTNNVGPTASQVVGVFNDGVYAATTAQVMGSFLDTQRVEVLRGPQGTLYGRNTFAGAINIISNEPDFDGFSGNLSGTLGSYNRTRVEGVVNVPVSETFALRFAGMGDHHDGYIENSWLDGVSDDLRNQDIVMGRVTAKWAPTDQLEATLRASYSDKNTNGDAIWGYTQIGCYRNNLDGSTSTGLSPNATFQNGHCYQPGPNASGRTGAGGDATSQDAGPWDVSRDGPSSVEAKDFSLNFQTTYEAEFATIKFIGAYNEYENLQYYDVDYSNGRYDGFDSFNNGFGGHDNDQESISAELQINDNSDGPLEWMLGAYYFKSKADWGFGFLNNGTYTPYSAATDSFDSKSTAIFANAKYSISDNFRVLGGLRLNSDDNELRNGTTSVSESPVTWKAGLEYDFGDDELFYATVSTGYRTGGVNGTALQAAGAPEFFTSEEVTAYEAGVKGSFGDFTYGFAAYFNDYSNMHAQSFVSSCIDPANPTTCIASEYTENGGEIESKGLELEFNWLPGDNFFVNGTLSLQDAEFGNYLVGRVNGLGNFEGRQDVTRTTGEIVQAGGVPSLSLEGWTPALTPDYSVSLQAGYVFDMGGDNYVTPMVQTALVGDYWGFDFNVPGSEQDSYMKTDLRLRWENGTHGFTVEGFVENLENEAVLTRGIVFSPSQADIATASIQANYGDPRTWGIKVGVEF